MGDILHFFYCLTLGTPTVVFASLLLTPYCVVIFLGPLEHDSLEKIYSYPIHLCTPSFSSGHKGE